MARDWGVRRYANIYFKFKCSAAQARVDFFGTRRGCRHSMALFIMWKLSSPVLARARYARIDLCNANIAVYYTVNIMQFYLLARYKHIVGRSRLHIVFLLLFFSLLSLLRFSYVCIYFCSFGFILFLFCFIFFFVV